MWPSIYKSILRTAVLDCFSTVSRVNVYHPGEMVDILHFHLLIVYWRLLSFVHVLCLLLCYDRASCKIACGWWVILYKYVLKMIMIIINRQKCQLERKCKMRQFIKFGNMFHDQNMQWNYNSMWNIQLSECYLHDVLLITISTKINCQPLPCGGC